MKNNAYLDQLADSAFAAVSDAVALAVESDELVITDCECLKYTHAYTGDAWEIDAPDSIKKAA